MKTIRLFLKIATAMLITITACNSQPNQKNDIQQKDEGIELWPASVENTWGFVDKQGKFVINPQYDNVGIFEEGLASVEVNGKRGYIDKQGKIVINPQFDFAMYFSEGLAMVSVGLNLYGFIDKQGEYVVNPQFYLAQPFTEGLASVTFEKEWGYINKKGLLMVFIAKKI